MSTLSSSVVQLLYEQTVNAGDWLDLTNHCLIASAQFDSASNANPGTMEVTLRDPDVSLPVFVTGHRVKLIIDGQPMWSGFTKVNGRGFFLPAGDGRTPTHSRKFVLRGVDNNCLLDSRILRNSSDYLNHIPYVTADEQIGATLKRALNTYSDMPSADPWLDLSTFVDNIGLLSSETGRTIQAALDISDPANPKGPWEYPQQGTKLRETFDAIAAWTGAVYYLGPDDAVHLHAIQNRECPWGFSDRPNLLPISSSSGPFEGAYYGFREFNEDEDGSSLATDAIVWGGSEWAGSGQTVAYRATDPTLEAIHGKWQMSETHFDDTNYKLQKGVTQRANMIVFGNPTGTGGGSEPGTVPGEGPRGLRFPSWSAGFVWHTTNVPVHAGIPRHLYPGDIVPIQLWSFSEDGGTTPFLKYLPLRSLRIKFVTGTRDGKAVVRFEGSFNLLNVDNKFLWAWLRRREPQLLNNSGPVIVTNASTSAPLGGDGRFTPAPATDGATTVFSIPFGYIPGSLTIYKSGLQQTWGVAFTETNPSAGTFTFAAAPLVTDTLFVHCLTLAG